MSATATSVPALGVGMIIGESFSLFFRRIHWFALLAFLPQVVAMLLVAVAIGGVAGFGASAGQLDSPRLAELFAGPMLVLVLVVTFLTVLIPLALSVTAAYDAKLGTRFRLGRYVSAGLGQIVPLLVCWLIIMVLFSLTAPLFVVPGLWVLSVFSAVVPSIVIERSGFSALGRSIRLTKGYRWPIVGTLVVVGLGAMLLGIVISVAIAVGQFVLSPLLTDPGHALGIVVAIAAVVVQSLNLAIIYGLPCVAVALIYARLREIKEGTSVESMTEVFA